MVNIKIDTNEKKANSWELVFFLVL
jgi:hypothetical protein